MKERRSFSKRTANLLLLLAGVFLVADVPAEAPSESEISAAVSGLRAEAFQDREAASQRVWEFGLAARAALREAVKSEDPEISQRAGEILKNLELGIFADTPPETAALIREYHAGTAAQRRQVLRRLSGEQQAIRLRLILSETDPEQRATFIREFGGTGDRLVQALRDAGEMDSARELLAAISPRDWAVYLRLEGEAEAERVRLKAQEGDQDHQVDPARRVWLSLVLGDLAEARREADRSEDAGLKREVYLRQADWKALVSMDDGVMPGDNEVERLGFAAAFYAKAGEEAKAAEAIDKLSKLEIKDEYMARNCAIALMINDRPDLAAERFERQGPLTMHELSFLLERLDIGRIFTRLGVEPPGKGAGDAIEERIAESLEAGRNPAAVAAQRELFYLCRSVGELLVRIGERDEARKVFLATRPLTKSNPSLLAYLAASCRKEGFVEDGRAMALDALAAGEINSTLSAWYPGDRAVAQLWWDYYRARKPENSLEQTFECVTVRVDPEAGEDHPELPVLIGEVAKWIEGTDPNEQSQRFGALGKICGAQEDWDSALRYLRRQSETGKSPAQALIEAGDLLAGRERWEEAAKLYAEAGEADPNNELAVYLLGHALKQSGDEETGEERMAAAIRMPLANSTRRNQFALGLARRGLPEAAAEQWGFILQTAPAGGWEGYEAWAMRNACLQMASGLVEESPGRAADLLERYLHTFLKTNTSMTMRYYVIYRSRVHALRFDQAMTSGDLEEAIDLGWKAVAARPGDVNLVIDVVERLQAAGKGEVADGMYAQTIDRLRKTLKLFPESAIEHNNLAWLAGRTGRDLEEAQEHARAAVESAPGLATYLDTLAEVSFRRGERTKAIELARRCVEIEPADEHYREQLERFERE